MCVANVQYMGSGWEHLEMKYTVVDFFWMCLKTLNSVCREVKEVMGVSIGLPYVLFYVTNGGWKSCASIVDLQYDVLVSCCYRSGEGPL